MKKLPYLLLVFFLAPIIAGVYGILHDQLTYSISPEYYTEFKFIQFNIPPEGWNRTGVGLVGWKATWWMGFPIGLILGAAGLVLLHEEKYLSNVIQAFGITMGIALTTGIVGLLYGLFFLSVKPASFFHSNGWFIPEGLVDFKNFIAVGSMHNFSYVGGLSGLIAGVAFLVIKRSKTNEETL